MPGEGDRESFRGYKECEEVPEVREYTAQEKRKIRRVLGVYELSGMQIYREYLWNKEEEHREIMT